MVRRLPFKVDRPNSPVLGPTTEPFSFERCGMAIATDSGRRCTGFAILRFANNGDCHASYDKGFIGFGVDCEFVRRRLCAGCRRRWRRYWWRRWYRGRHRRWTRWNRDGNAKCKWCDRLTVRRVRFEHDGKIVRQFGETNEEGRDGFACLRQRNEEGLLTAVLGGSCTRWCSTCQR